MTSIALRAYTREIEGLIGHDQRLDEAIAHCRQILGTYPKCLEAYRLLGKAYLEGRRYAQAVDIFERLLVAVPDDFVAHVGMSIIADDQGKLDDAIWHMERAFEVQPSNPAIQGELQRLFGRRDGVEPPKIRLTRGALAHMYVQGQLYNQAISEIRTVLSQDAERADLQILLAKAYFHGGQKTEAADVCAKLLGDYPYCFDANRLMVELLTGTKSVEAAQEYRQRVIELDPYAEFAHDSIYSSDAVPEKSVMLERLEYVGQAPEGRPLLGMGFGEPAAAYPSAAAPASVPALRPEDDMPAFLRGTRPADSAALEAAKAEEEPAGEAAPGDLPDWVKALAPLGVSEPEETEPAAPESLPWMRVEAPAASAPGETTPAESAPIDTHESEIPSWLRDVESQPGEPMAETESQPPSLEPPVEPLPYIGSLGTAPEEKEEGLAWLESLAAKHGASPEEMITSPESRTEATPEWVDRASEIARQAAEAWTSMEAEPAEAAPSEAGAPPDSVTSSGAEVDESKLEIPEKTEEAAPVDWLQSLAQEGTYSEDADESASAETPSLPGTVPEWPRVTPPPRVGEEPPWLESAAPSLSSEAQTPGRETSGEYESEGRIPDWLADFDTETSGARPAPQSEAPPPWLETEAETEAEVPQPSTPRDWQPAEAGLAAEAEAEAFQAEEPFGLAAETEEVAPAISRAEVPPRAPKQPLPSLGSAQTELGRGNIAAALDIYGKLIQRGKSLTEIIRDLRDALYRYPVEVPIWQALGDAYMRANRLQEALDAYTKAEELLR